MNSEIYRINCKEYPMLKKFPVKILKITDKKNAGIATVEIISHNKISHTLPNFWQNRAPGEKYGHGSYHYRFNPDELKGFQFKVNFNDLELIK